MNMSANPSPLSTGGVIYHWPRGFLLLAPGFVVDRGEHPTRRPSIRLMLATGAPFEIEFSDGTRLQTQAVLMSAGVRRRKILAGDRDFVLLDLAASSPEYRALVPLVEKQAIVNVEFSKLASILPDLASASAGMFSNEKIRELCHRMIHTITGRWPQEGGFDRRIDAALALIHAQPLEKIRLQDLADTAHLSADRFRHLFKQQVGYTVSHYARTAAVWKVLSRWSQDMQLTEIAHEVGFHDSSHFNHAFKEMFGFNPTVILGQRYFKFIPCR